MTVHVQGTKFQRGALVSEVLTWTTIGGCKGMTPPDQSRGTIDVTTIDQYDGSDIDPNKKFEGADLIESGSVELDMIFDPSSSAQELLETDMLASTPVDYRFLYKNGDSRQFKGVVTNIKPSSNMDDILRQTVSIKVSGSSAYVRAE